MTVRLLTSLSNPIFMSKNFINRFAEKASDLTWFQGGVTQTSGIDLSRIFDMVRSSFWTSSGSASAVEERIEVGFYEGADQFARDFDFVAIMNHNLRRFKIEYQLSDGGWFTVPGSDFTGSDFSGTNIILSFTPNIIADEIRIVATETQAGTGDEKKVGDFIVALSSLQLSKGFRRFDKDYRDNVKTLVYADGSIDETKIARAPTSASFWIANVSLKGITYAERDLIFEEKEKLPPLLMYPEPGERPGDIFSVRFMPDSFKDIYTSLNKLAGVDVQFSLEDVGGG